MKIRVAFNATPLLAPLTGIGNYILHLGNALAQRADIDLFSFYAFRVSNGPPQVAPELVVARQRSLPWRLARRYLPMKRELRALQQRLAFKAAFRRNRIELYHEPNYVPVRYDVPVVVTVHDLSWIHFPHMHPADRVRWLERGFARALERAAAILVDSTYIREELIATFAVPAERVHVAHLGVGAEFRPYSGNETSATLRRLDLQHGNYVLSVGTIEPRKNIRHVLRAYALLPEAVRRAYPLVVAGAKGWHARDLEQDLGNMAERGQIRFLGHVDGADLPLLYAGAALFVFASVYEGFGLPVLEAMACGTAVLASDRSSLPEVVGDAGCLIDPDVPEKTSDQIAALLSDAQQRQRLADAARARAALFSWAGCAQATVDAYTSALHLAPASSVGPASGAL